MPWFRGAGNSVLLADPWWRFLYTCMIDVDYRQLKKFVWMSKRCLSLQPGLRDSHDPIEFAVWESASLSLFWPRPLFTGISANESGSFAVFTGLLFCNAGETSFVPVYNE
jgi:hypothetical protein